MTLTKPEIRALVEIYSGTDTLKELADSLGITLGMASITIKKLESKSLCIGIRRKKMEITPAATSPAEEFRKLLVQRKQASLQKFLHGLKFQILSSCLYEPKTAKQIASMLNISLKSVQNNISQLANMGLLTRQKRNLSFNKTAWPYLFNFLEAYRNFSMNGSLLWKFGPEQVFEVRNKEQIEGTLTGFSAYGEYGVRLVTIKHCCYLPGQKLSKADIFLHSLMQIRDDTRLLNLAIAFFKKNKLNAATLLPNAVKYDLESKLTDFIKIIKSKDENIKKGSLPPTARREINEMLKLYNVKK